MNRLFVAGCVVVLAACQGKGGEKKAPEPSGGGVRMGVQKERPKIGGLGEKRLAGAGTDLRATADGKIVTVLLDAEKPRLEGVPQPMRLGVLWAVPTAGGEPVKLGNGVTNMPGGQLFSKDSRWAFFLAGYNAAQQSGELMAQDLQDLKTERQRLGGAVTYVVPSDDSKRVAFVDDGVLKAGPLPAGPFKPISGEVATADFAPQSGMLYFRRRVSAGGGLFQASLDDDKRPPKKLTDQVGDYELSKDGGRLAWTARETASTPRFELFTADATALKPQKLADSVLRFQLSPDGKWIVWVQGDTPTEPGELWLAAADGAGAKKIGERVNDYAFAADSTRLAFRQKFHPVSLVGEQVERVGELMLVSLPDGAVTSVQKNCANFVFSPDGKHLAFGGSVFKPAFSRDLYLLKAGAKDPVKLKEWIYEYAFAPGSDRLFFRADCTREGRACLLYSVDPTAAEAKPSQEADSVYNFRLSHEGARVAFTYAHTQGDLYDVSVLNLKTKERKTIEQDVKLPILFLEKDGSRLAYLVADKARAGVYVGSQVP